MDWSANYLYSVSYTSDSGLYVHLLDSGSSHSKQILDSQVDAGEWSFCTGGMSLRAVLVLPH